MIWTLLRHFEPAITGHEDRLRPLTEHGRKQAAIFGNKHRGFFDLAIVSPSLRTIETFELVISKKIPFHVETLLYDLGIKPDLEIFMLYQRERSQLIQELVAKIQAQAQGFIHPICIAHDGLLQAIAYQLSQNSQAYRYPLMYGEAIQVDGQELKLLKSDR